MAGNDNCTQMIAEHFSEPSQENSANFLNAVTMLCDNLATFPANKTMEKFFNSFCCSNTDVQTLCTDFITVNALNVSLACFTPSPTTDLNMYTYAILIICLLLGLPANLFIIYTVLRYRKLPKQTGHFLCSLAAGDIGVISVFVIYLIYNKYDTDIDLRMHIFLLPSLDILFAAVSLLQISVISVDRAIAVKRPLLYPKYITPLRAKYMTAFVWLFSILFFILSMIRVPLKSKGYELFFFYLSAVILLLLPIIIVTLSYTLVLISAYRYLKLNRKRSLRLLNEKKPPRSASWVLPLMLSKEIKISANIALIVVPFLCCWGFFTFVHVYETLSGYFFGGVANWLILVLPILVSSTNPIVYLLLTPKLRKLICLPCTKKWDIHTDQTTVHYEVNSKPNDESKGETYL